MLFYIGSIVTSTNYYLLPYTKGTWIFIFFSYCLLVFVFNVIRNLMVDDDLPLSPEQDLSEANQLICPNELPLLLWEGPRELSWCYLTLAN